MNLKEISAGRVGSVTSAGGLGALPGAFVPKRLALVTDAWKPQTNGVVNTLVKLIKNLEDKGTEVLVV
ncbi:MAG TPA: hypothetical protein VLA14_00335, partial [Polyangia bacterium]|nr:hypothetical protein [Polyangia bacterium]